MTMCQAIMSQQHQNCGICQYLKAFFFVGDFFQNGEI